MNGSSYYVRPTLLVGVGGTGCKIAENIFLEAKKSDTDKKTRIGVLVFDTDVNDLNRMSTVDPNSRVQLSNANPVYRILKNNPDAEGDWFHNLEDIPNEIKNLKLIEGAAQVRLLTRLALHDSFRNKSSIASTERAIRSIAVADGRTSFDGVVNVLIAGSLAGATGSGSFYQIALMIRDVCTSSKVEPNITGLFLLPDVYANSGTLPSDQIVNVRANAYASIKELNAINVLATAPERGADFTYSYRPGRPLRDGETPFSSVTFIDYESSRGGNMGRSLGNYLRMAVRAGHLLIFTPLGQKYGSMTVNDVRARIAASQEGNSNIYSGIGISALIYPNDSMRKYLADRLVAQNLSGDWLRLDNLFQTRLNSFSELDREGKASGEKPRIEETFLRDFELLATEEEVPFFKNMWRSLHPIVTDERTKVSEVRSQTDEFLREIRDYARRSFWRADSVEGIDKRQNIDHTVFDSTNQIGDQVRQFEFRLDRDLERVDAAVRTEPETIFNAAWTTADQAKESDWQPYHIQYYIIRGDSHPVQTRALLYELRRKIVELRNGLDPSGLRRNLFRRAGVFNPDRDSKPTTRGDPRVYEEAEAAGKRSIWDIFERRSKEFISKYVNYYNSSVKIMQQFADEALLVAILDSLEKEVEALQSAYAGLFSEISSISKEIDDRIENEANKYSRHTAASDGTLWVFANRDCREAAWRGLQSHATMVNVGSDVNRHLGEAIFNLYRQNRKARTQIAFNDLGEVFRKSVVEGFGDRVIRQNFAREWDFSVVEAVKRETEVLGAKNWQEYLRERVRLVSDQSEPFLTLTDSDAVGQRVKFWTINPEIKHDIGSEQLYDEIFTIRSGDSPVEEPEFSKYGLYCVNFCLNLELDDLTKIHPGSFDDTEFNPDPPGKYHAAFDEIVDELIAAEMDGSRKSVHFTPLAHKDWHRPGILPEISTELEMRRRRERSRALMIAEILELIERRTDYGRPLAVFSTREISGVSSADKELVGTHDFFEISRVFEQSPDVVRLTEDCWQAFLESFDGDAEEETGDWERFIRTAPLINSCSIVEIRRDAKRRERKAGEYIAAWCGAVREVIDDQCQHLDIPGRYDLSEKLTGEARESVMREMESKVKRDETFRTIQSIFDSARKKFLEKSEAGVRRK